MLAKGKAPKAVSACVKARSRLQTFPKGDRWKAASQASVRMQRRC